MNAISKDVNYEAINQTLCNNVTIYIKVFYYQYMQVYLQFVALEF